MNAAQFDILARTIARSGAQRRGFLRMAGAAMGLASGALARGAGAAQDTACLANVSDAASAGSGSLLHFTTEQWEQATAEWKSVEVVDGPDLGGALEAVPMPGQAGGMLVGVGLCSPGCEPGWRFDEMLLPDGIGGDELGSGVVPQCACGGGELEAPEDEGKPVFPGACTASNEACRLVVQLDPPRMVCVNSGCGACDLNAARSARDGRIHICCDCF